MIDLITCKDGIVNKYEWSSIICKKTYIWLCILNNIINVDRKSRGPSIEPLYIFQFIKDNI